MARMQRRRRFVNGSGQRRPTYWARGHGELTLAAAGVPSTLNLLADYRTERGITANDPGTTVAGGWISFGFETGGAGVVQKLAIGIIVVDENTGGQVPNPLDDQHVDWLWLWNGYVSDTSPEGGFVSVANERIRSRRRMDEIGMNCWLSAASQQGGSLQVDTSILLRLR